VEAHLDVATRAAAVGSVGAQLSAHEALHHEMLQRAAAGAEGALDMEVALAKGASAFLKGAVLLAAEDAEDELQRLVGAAEAFLAMVDAALKEQVASGSPKEGASGEEDGGGAMRE
jgi:hypothetical protein